MTTPGVAGGTINLTELMDNSRVGWLQVRVFVLCLASLIMDGFDVQVMGFVATTMFAELNAPPSALGGLLGLGNFGVLIGALIFSMVADKIGRRPVLVWATLFFAVMTLATAFAQNLEQLRLLRFIAGIGLGSIIPNATALVGEYSPKRTRVRLDHVHHRRVHCRRGRRRSSHERADRGVWGWRSVFIFGGVVPLVVAVFMFVSLPESLQFLAVRRRRFDLLARWLKELDPTLRVDASTQFISNETSRGGVPFWHLFRERRAVVTILLWIVNFTNILVLYSLSGFLPTIFQTLMGYDRSTANWLATIVQVGGTAGAFGLAWLILRRGYTPMLTLTFAVATVSVALIGQPGLSLPRAIRDRVHRGLVHRRRTTRSQRAFGELLPDILALDRRRRGSGSRSNRGDRRAADRRYARGAAVEPTAALVGGGGAGVRFDARRAHVVAQARAGAQVGRGVARRDARALISQRHPLEWPISRSSSSRILRWSSPTRRAASRRRTSAGL